MYNSSIYDDYKWWNRYILWWYITALNDSSWVIITARNDREEDCMYEWIDRMHAWYHDIMHTYHHHHHLSPIYIFSWYHLMIEYLPDLTVHCATICCATTGKIVPHHSNLITTCQNGPSLLLQEFERKCSSRTYSFVQRRAAKLSIYLSNI